VVHRCREATAYLAPIDVVAHHFDETDESTKPKRSAPFFLNVRSFSEVAFFSSGQEHVVHLLFRGPNTHAHHTAPSRGTAPRSLVHEAVSSLSSDPVAK
jgi:hypothetical protein